MAEFSFVKNSANEQTPERTLMVLTYEVCQVAQCILDASYHGSDGYRAASRTEVSDAISMLRMYCEHIKVDYRALTPDVEFVSPVYMVVMLGRIVKAHHYTYVFGSPLYHYPLLPSLGNLKYHLYHYCELMHWVYDEVERLGEEHYLERMAHVREEGVQK